MKRITLLIGLLFLFGSWNGDRKFPDFMYKTIEGKTISNDYFKDTTTMVIHFRLGCVPSMFLLKDLQLLEKDKPLEFKVLLIAENTNMQILEFNSEEENDMSGNRKKYGIQKVTYDVIGECEKEKYAEIDGHLLSVPGCGKLAKKLRINSSPVIFKVDSEGRIIGKFDHGYLMKSDPDELEEIIRNL